MERGPTWPSQVHTSVTALYLWLHERGCSDTTAHGDCIVFNVFLWCTNYNSNSFNNAQTTENLDCIIYFQTRYSLLVLSTQI